MDIQQLHSAVQEAFSRADYAACFEMLDQFLETATGHAKGRALNIKASVILCDPRRAPEGLALVDEALELQSENPEHSLRTLTTALGICGTMGDVDKASRYETMAHHLLQQHGDNPGVKNMQFRLYINLGNLSNLRGQPHTAYWHFVKASACLEQADIPQEEARRFFLASYLLTAQTCVVIGRGPEAAEAIEKARPLVSSKQEFGRWSVYCALVLRSQNRCTEARATLNRVSGDEAEWHPEDRARFHLEQALIAQEVGSIREFHLHLSAARQIAEANSLEFLLCDIQRAQRSPVNLEVMR